LERAARYITRPPVTIERLSFTPQGSRAAADYRAFRERSVTTID
jgi:hypothetical protein